VRLAIWLSTAILTGVILMALEMAAVRLFAPYFGYSIYVWGTTICVVMGAMAVGYAAGGWLADSKRAELMLFIAILTAATWQLLMIAAMRPLLSRLAQSNEAFGVSAAALILFAPSMIALAATGPILVRLCASSGTVGRSAGLIYALSTVGSMGGVVMTISWLLPSVGTDTTLRLLCGLTFLIGACGLSSVRIPRKKLAVILAVAPLTFLHRIPGLDWSDGAVWTAESSYNVIRVVRNGSQTLLQLNQAMSIHSIMDSSGPWTGYYYDYFALGPVLVPAKRALVLGMGGGGSIRSMRITAPAVEIDAVEIDPKVVEAATRWFGLNVNDQRLHMHVADARQWLSRHGGPYDIVQLDVFQGGPYVPFYLMTDEFFRLMRTRMSGDAVLMMNVFDVSKDSQLLFSTAATLRRVFPSVKVGVTNPGNYMLFAFTRARTDASTAQRPSVLQSQMGVRDMQLVEIVPPAGTRVFTDDVAPVEAMTRRMLTGH
jgi:spermidine synthase